MESTDQLVRRIGKLGIKQSYLKRILPQWSLDYPPSDRATLLELYIQLARDLGLDLPSLRSEAPAAFLALPVPAKFKRLQNVAPVRLKPATSMFYSLARSVAAACPVPVKPLPQDPEVFRACILKEQRAVTLGGVLDFLWSHGIPVVHYSDWPEGLPRPTAMVINVDGRPVIVLGSKRKENGYQAFYVAHEAGHVALGHVEHNGTLVDVSEEQATSPDEDPQETEADQYALTLLGGASLGSMKDLDIRARDFATALKTLSQAVRVDRSHLLLRYGMDSGKWDIAVSALQKVEAGADAPVLINRDHAEGALNLEALAEDRQAFLNRVLALT